MNSETESISSYLHERSKANAIVNVSAVFIILKKIRVQTFRDGMSEPLCQMVVVSSKVPSRRNPSISLSEHGPLIFPLEA